MPFIPYVYRHALVPGGGFVTGFVFHPHTPGIAYARTDIGGVYRYEPDSRTWKSLCDHITHPGRWETYPLSLALSPMEVNRLYIAAGDGKANNKLCISHDRGEHFLYRDIPTGIHGNASGRGTGGRLLVSVTDANILYFASQTGGLFVTRDLGTSWEHIAVCPQGGREETNLTFVFAHPDNEDFLIVGSNGEKNSPDGIIRGPSLFYSTDGGNHFDCMPGQPAPLIHPGSTNPGYVAQRYAFDGQYLYITFSEPGYCWAGFNSYACDTGSCIDGVLLRYRISPDGEIRETLDLTPTGYSDPGCPARRLGCGLAGISVDPNHPGVVVMSTICHPDQDTIYHSRDFGMHFTPILQGLSIGQIDFTVDYMKPEYNGGQSIVHWMGDLKIDPHDGNNAFFTTGTGVFATFNLLHALENKTVTWQPLCCGLEETVHLNVYSPCIGPVKLIDIIGDLGGFAFRSLNHSCKNSFADAQGNRYITCMNADYPDSTTRPMVVTARGNWKGKTTGGLIVSHDDCESWTRLPDPNGISPLVDTLMASIRHPNVNAGWTAVTSDGKTILWGLANGNELPIPALLYTDDEGQTWYQSLVYDLNGVKITEVKATIKVFSDRVWQDIFYGFGQESRMFVSLDKGRTFRELPLPVNFPIRDLSGIDSKQHYEIRAQRNAPGILWLSLAEAGLWRLSIDLNENNIRAECISREGDAVYRVGLGKEEKEGAPQALYINGTLEGAYGFYRSLDGGSTFQRINTDRQMFGDIRSICGDPRTIGRFYIATGTRGILYGEPESHNER
jgi:xyloglucan-specific exo-beta-1,4-glucanase